MQQAALKHASHPIATWTSYDITKFSLTLLTVFKNY